MKSAKLVSIFKQLDRFGDNVSFNMQGQQQFKTWMGTILSVLSYILVTSYAINKFDNVRQKLETTHSRIVQTGLVSQEAIYDYAETSLSFAFTFREHFATGEPVPEDFNKYINFAAFQETNSYEDTTFVVQ